jgi:DNA-binding NarL/FixJ family response regulator
MSAAPASSALRILLVDDHAVVRQGLMRLLSGANENWAIQEAAHGFEALDALRASAFDLVVLDLSMPRMNGFDLVRRIRRDHPGVFVLVLTMHNEEQYAVRAFEAGAQGFVTKDCAAQELLTAVAQVAGGGVYVSTGLAARVIQQLHAPQPGPKLDLLSNRELDILQRIVQGQKLTDIADELHLSIKTVSTHKTHIQEKLGLDSTAALIRFGLEHHVGSPPLPDHFHVPDHPPQPDATPDAGG